MSSLKQTIKLQQSQKLNLSLQMQESLKLLQLSNQEILEYINNTVKNNPLLELEKNIKSIKKIEFGEENYASKQTFRKKNNEDTNNDKNIENTIDLKKNLRNHILEQINIDIKKTKEKNVAKKIVEYIDNNGYINEDDIDKTFHFCFTKKIISTRNEIKKVLEKIQKFDPPGVFARNLSECLEIQLKHKKIYNKKYKYLLENLELVGKNKIDLISKKIKLEKKDVQKMLENIKSLNPKPGASYDFDENITIVPDMTLDINNGVCKVNFNKLFVPKVRFNKNYYDVIKKKKMLRREIEHLKKWAANGRWFVSALNKRVSTMEMVTKEIVNIQKKFFTHGIEYLSPLTLKDIAKKTKLHESTISRCTANKYIETPKGMYELKYFFSKGIKNDQTLTNISNKIVKEKIFSLIKEENKSKRMSDESIVLNLKKTGINIARRTVAKYRKSMNLPGSSRRKENNF